MKMISIPVSIELAKAEALRFYMSKRDASPEQELEKTLEAMYEKHVPKDARELIEWQSANKKQRPVRSRTTGRREAGQPPPSPPSVPYNRESGQGQQ